MDPVGAIGMFVFLTGSAMASCSRGRISIFWACIATIGGFVMAINQGLL